jgi:hypothetical protein
MQPTLRLTGNLIEWCRGQQLAALDHMKPDHKCDHPQCCPENNERWLLDAFAEELEIDNAAR